MACTFLRDLRPKDKQKIIEVKVYRAWITTYPPNPTPKGYCCMLLDKTVTAIQSNMDINDMDYFRQIIDLNRAYRISNFLCEETRPWQRTLPNPVTLKFGRFTTFEPIAAHDFPHHHFDFVSYNQLYSKLPKSSTLTDYIGCIQMIGDVAVSGDPNKNQTFRRTIDIENLNGNVVQFTMWDTMATSFDKGVNSMPKPVMIAVTSCRVQEYHNQLQLSATPATHFYLNPNIEEVTQSMPEYRAKFDINPPLQVVKQRYTDKEKEKTRNRHPLLQLLGQNPDTYKYVRFTCEGTVVELDSSHNWFQYACTECSKKLTDQTLPFECQNHGPQPKPEIRYCFKATVADDSTTATFTFFSPNADVITNIECWKLVKELRYSDPHELPPQLEAIKGIHHIFQFHYNPSSKKGSVEFILDTLLDDPIIEAEPAKRQAFDTSDIKEMDTKKQKNKATTVITDK